MGNKKEQYLIQLFRLTGGYLKRLPRLVALGLAWDGVHPLPPSSLFVGSQSTLLIDLLVFVRAFFFFCLSFSLLS